MSGFLGNQPLTQAQRLSIDHDVVDGQSTYDVNYTPGFLDIIVNGSTLQKEDYTAINATSITLVKATVTGDSLSTVSWGTFVSADNIQPDDPRIATAWCRFDGTLTGTNAPVAGYNVASVTRASVGVYDINFTTPLDSADYSAVPGASSVIDAAINGDGMLSVLNYTTTSVRLSMFNSSVAADGKNMSLHIFGGKN